MDIWNKRIRELKKFFLEDDNLKNCTKYSTTDRNLFECNSCNYYSCEFCFNYCHKVCDKSKLFVTSSKRVQNLYHVNVQTTVTKHLHWIQTVKISSTYQPICMKMDVVIVYYVQRKTSPEYQMHLKVNVYVHVSQNAILIYSYQA